MAHKPYKVAHKYDKAAHRLRKWEHKNKIKVINVSELYKRKFIIMNFEGNGKFNIKRT